MTLERVRESGQIFCARDGVDGICRRRMSLSQMITPHTSPLIQDATLRLASAQLYLVEALAKQREAAIPRIMEPLVVGAKHAVEMAQDCLNRLLAESGLVAQHKIASGGVRGAVTSTLAQ